MVLPLALALLGGAIGLDQRAQARDKKAEEELRRALMGATQDYAGAYMNPEVSQELSSAVNPLMGRPTPRLAANPRSAQDPRTRANLGMFNALNQVDPMAAVQFAGKMAPQAADPWAKFKNVDGLGLVEIGPDGRPKVALGKPTEQKIDELTTLYNIDNGKAYPVVKGSPEYNSAIRSGLYSEDRIGGAQAPQLKPVYDVKAGKLLGDLNVNDPDVLKRLMSGEISTAKPEKPSETENRFGYHAGLISREMKTVKDVVQKHGKGSLTSAAPTYALMGDPERIVFGSFSLIVDSLLNLATGAAYNQLQSESYINGVRPSMTDGEEVKRAKLTRINGLIEQAKQAARTAGENIEVPDMSIFFENAPQRQTPPGFNLDIGQSRMIGNAKVTRKN